MSSVTIVGVTIVIIIIAAISKSKDILLGNIRGVYDNVIEFGSEEKPVRLTNDLKRFDGSCP